MEGIHWFVLSLCGDAGTIAAMAAEQTKSSVKGQLPGRLACCLALVGLLVYQGWMALGLFGAEAPWQALLSAEPILSGVHPQHYYLGTLGAEALRGSGSSCCYVPEQAGGFPKTPIFNGGRIAELLIYLAGTEYRAPAYKAGVAALCLAAPLLILLSARAAKLSNGGCVLATFIAVIVWWSYPARTALEAGKVDLLLASLAAVAHICLLVRFDRRPSLLSWLGLVAAGTLGCLAQPLLCPFLLLLFLVYYLGAGMKHGCPTWHFAVLLSQVLPLALNAFWLLDWVAFWWLRVPLSPLASLFEPRPVSDLWTESFWGSQFDLVQAAVLAVSAALGLLLLHFAQERLSARLFLVSLLTLLVPAFFRIWSEPFGPIGTTDLFISILWLLIVPAAYALTQILGTVCRLTGKPLAAGVTLAAAGTGAIAYGYHVQPETVSRYFKPAPLAIGLQAEQQAIVDTLKQKTDGTARILWEDRPAQANAPFWTALLPSLTGRTFLGGFDPLGTIEHSSVGLVGEWLERRPLREWSNEALEDYCRRYNVGWVACFSPEAVARLRAWPRARQLAELRDGDTGFLFAIDRKHSYILKGQARLIHADSRHLMLADVTPENGVIVLSFHYQSGMRALPTRIDIEREPNGDHLIGFIRLRLAGPAARVTLTWSTLHMY